MLKSKLLKVIVQEHNIKHGTIINHQFLKNIAQRHSLNLKDLIKILGIVPIKEYINIKSFFNKKRFKVKIYTDRELINIYYLVNNKINKDSIEQNWYIEYQEFLKIKDNIKEKENTLNLQKQIINIIKNDDYLTKKQLEKINLIEGINTKIIKDTLTISNRKFSNLCNNKIKKTRIVVNENIRKIFLLKMDFKYYELDKFYTKKQLMLKSKYFEISIEELLKNISSSEKRYKFDLQALNTIGKLYIGEEHPLSYNFINKYFHTIMKICKYCTKKYTTLYNLGFMEGEFIDTALEKIITTCGIIEKNFLFDEKLLFSLIKVRCKYIVLNECKKIIREKCNINKYIINNINNFVLKPKEEKFESSFEQLKMQSIVVKCIWKNIEFIEIDRKEGMKIVAEELKITYEELLKKLNDIQKTIIEYGIVKKCKNGTIIKSGIY